MKAKKLLTKKQRLVAAELLLWFTYDATKFLQEITEEYYLTQKEYRGTVIDGNAPKLVDVLIRGRKHKQGCRERDELEYQKEMMN